MLFYAAVQYGEHPPLAAGNGIDKARQRITRLAKAVQQSSAAITERTKGSNDEYQAVFVAPEFYFVNDQAPAAPDRYLDHASKQWTVAQIAALAADYPKLLMIPGTLLWMKEKTAANVEKTKQRIRGADARFQRMLPDLQRKYAAEYTSSQVKGTQAVKNIVAAQTFASGWAYGGVPQTPLPAGRRASLYIDEVSQLGIAQNVAYICKGLKILKYPKIGNSAELAGQAAPAVFAPGSIAGLFSVGKVRYGLEVCMDHWLGILRHGTDNLPQPHIHIVTSAQTPNRPFHFQVADNGLILHASTNPNVHPWIKGEKSKGIERVDLAPDLKLLIFDLAIDAAGKATDELRSDGTSPLPEVKQIHWELIDKETFRSSPFWSELI